MAARNDSDALAATTADAWLALENLRSCWRRRIGISAYEMHALSNLRDESTTVGELGERLALSSGAMTGLVDRLVSAGLLERVQDEADRRRVLLRTTSDADASLAELESNWTARLAAVRADVGEAAIATAVDIMGRIAVAARSMSEEARA